MTFTDNTGVADLTMSPVMISQVGVLKDPGPGRGTYLDLKYKAKEVIALLS